MSGETTYELALARELSAVGITGSLRRRILDEIADHLACDPDAPLGDPRSMARQFADVAGSARAKTAALAAFASLVVAGVLSALVVLAGGGLLRAVQRAGGPIQGARQLATVAGMVATGAAQLAFVAGTLAVLRWLWRREAGVLPAAEARVILRRAAVGVGAGIVTLVSLAVIGVTERHVPGAPSAGLVLAAAGAGVVSLLAALPSLRAAARVRPVTEGDPGDVLDDLGPLAPPALAGRPWRLATCVAVAVAVAITVAAIPAGDVYDGAARGLVDAIACLAGFALLGPYLGLWRRRTVAA